NNQYKYKPGMYSRAELSLETTNDAIVIPPMATILEPELLAKQVTGQRLRVVYVLKSDLTAERREIEIGEYSGDIVEVLSGLHAGDKLITRGHHSLKDGDKVRDMTPAGKVVPTKQAAPENSVANPTPSQGETAEPQEAVEANKEANKV
ncbi:MAG: hypothetical protein IJU23_05240, partial [Proteobacteria bacterium]|nr:hypothetical protein [Pseudomonadota bacterium]